MDRLGGKTQFDTAPVFLSSHNEMQPNFLVDWVEINFIEFKSLEAPDELSLKFKFIRFGSDVLHFKINV